MYRLTFLAKGELWGFAFLYWILSIHHRLWPTVGNGPGFLVWDCVFLSFLLLWAAAYWQIPVALQMWPCFFFFVLVHKAAICAFWFAFCRFLFPFYFTRFSLSFTHLHSLHTKVMKCGRFISLNLCPLLIKFIPLSKGSNCDRWFFLGGIRTSGLLFTFQEFASNLLDKKMETNKLKNSTLSLSISLLNTSSCSDGRFLSSVQDFYSETSAGSVWNSKVTLRQVQLKSVN